MSERREPKMYHELAEWFHLISAPEEYSEEAGWYSRALREASKRPVRRVLELGSGGGNNAWHMKREFELTLTDVAPGMLALSRTINPELEHIEGDMRSVRLGRKFDAVFVHDAITYMASEEDLRAAIETAAVHCEPRGSVLLCPDDTKETAGGSTSHGGHDGTDGRALRYLEWTWYPDPGADKYIAEYTYVMREADGTVRVEHDRHYETVFPRATWLRLLDECGFEGKLLSFAHSELDEPMDVFAGTRRED